LVENSPDPDADNVVTSTLFAPRGNDINQIIKQTIGSILPMEAERIQNVPAFLLFMAFLLWLAFEIIMRYFFLSHPAFVC
jgi:hypothetical protein